MNARRIHVQFGKCGMQGTNVGIQMPIEWRSSKAQMKI